MTQLPDEVLQDLANREVMCQHNWLYSVVPVGREFKPFLSGFCRGCSRVFSARIPTDVDGKYKETVINIPKEGPTTV